MCTLPREADSKSSEPSLPVKTGDERVSSIVGIMSGHNITMASRGGTGASRGKDAAIAHACL